MPQRIRAVMALLVVTMSTAAVSAEIEQVMQNWRDAFTEEGAERIAELYDEEAVLWGTLSPTIRNEPNLVQAYFSEAMNKFPLRTVQFEETLIRRYDDMAVASGRYTFVLGEGTNQVKLPARYSFTYILKGNRWLIVDHHSSTLPEP